MVDRWGGADEPAFVLGQQGEVLFRNGLATALLGETPLPAELAAGGETQVLGADGWPCILSGTREPVGRDRWVIRVRDVTRDRCLEASRGVAQRHDAMLAADRDAVLLIGELGRVLYANGAVERVLGHGPADLIGMRLDALLPKTRWSGVRQFFDCLQHVSGTDDSILRRDGVAIRAAVDLRCTHDGEQRFMVMTLRDKAPALPWGLAGSGAEFRLLVDSVYDHVICLLDADGRVASWNAGAERLTGYGRDEILGRPNAAFYSAEGRAAGKPAENLARAAREGRWQAEGWWVRKDGARIWVESSLTALRDEQGALQGFAKIVCDRTERMRAEVMRRALDAAEARSRFVRIAAHELRNPLAAVRGMAHLIHRRVRTGRPLEAQSEAVDMLVSEVDRLAALVNQILEMADGVGIGDPRPLDLVDLIGSLWSDGVEAPDVPVRVAGDPARLATVFRHLLTNAHKFSPPGTAVAVRVRAADGKAVVSVRDEGVGIPPDELERVFEGFSRGSNLAGRDPGGLGLGLYICREIVGACGGRIWVENNAGPGVTAQVELPLYHGARPSD